METWGFVNLLKEVAKTKVFDVVGSGKNSIQCARDASLFDVLIFVSEEKSFNEAMNLEHEVMMSKYK